ncbi:MAG: hypothetical protein Q4D54_04740 [Eubacteriales bacterium]|nr:hypothetical protein [Lachnospiraceae bacterium]MDO5127038.1 hypothetical protein [Eubacteriales bacterium]
MACFIVPAAEAVVTTVVAKAVKEKEKETGTKTETKIPFSKKIGWLSKLLWGGSGLLAFEHVWHGELIPYFPFLTAASDKQETIVMLKEMASVGGTMALALTGVWAIMLLVTGRMQKNMICKQTITK